MKSDQATSFAYLRFHPSSLGTRRSGNLLHPSLPKAAIIVADVHAAFCKIVCHFRPQRMRVPIGISPRAIAGTLRLGKNSVSGKLGGRSVKASY